MSCGSSASSGGGNRLIGCSFKSVLLLSGPS
jgi:hypothetical protein